MPWGVDLSSVEDEPEKPGEKPSKESRTGSPRAANDAGRGDTGAALRGIYQNTIDEKIPDDLLSLLGKLD